MIEHQESGLQKHRASSHGRTLRCVLTSFAIALLATHVAAAAPRTPYGGTVIAFAWGAPLAIDPRAWRTAADLSLARAVFEPLYGIDEKGELLPVLARGLPEIRGKQVIVPLHEGLVFHDGRPVTAAAVAAWLETLAEPESRAAHVLLAVKGAREKLAGDGTSRLAIQARSEDLSLVFELAQPYAEFPRLLASPHAAIAAPRAAGEGASDRTETRGASMFGTGPYMFSSAGKASNEEIISLSPFLGHRSGRPFIDALIVRESVSRFGTVSQLKRGDAVVVFGVPDVKAAKHHEIVPWSRARLPLELVVLSIGRKREGLRSERAYSALSTALNRSTLARRFLGAGAEPISTLFGELKERELSGDTPPLRTEATLIASKEDHAARRIAERVQLDLLRAGVTVVIEWVPPRTLDARRRDRRYDLMLDSMYPEWPGGPLAIDRFHELLSLTAPAGLPDSIISAEELGAFVRASEAERLATLGDLERTLRVRAGLIPIAAQVPVIAVRSDLHDFVLAPFGQLELADAFLAPPSGHDN